MRRSSIDDKLGLHGQESSVGHAMPTACSSKRRRRATGARRWHAVGSATRTAGLVSRKQVRSVVARARSRYTIPGELSALWQRSYRFTKYAEGIFTVYVPLRSSSMRST